MSHELQPFVLHDFVEHAAAGSGRVSLTPLRAGCSAATMIVCFLVVWRLGLPLKFRLVQVVIRSVMQLTILGMFILHPVFASRNWKLVTGYVGIMITITSLEARSRITVTYPGLLLHIVLSLAVGLSTAMGLTCFAIIRPTPWFNPQYLIPLSGMLLNNALSAITIGVAELLQGLHGTDGENAEILLCSGASRWEAVRPLVARSVRNGLIPTFNQMCQIGLVSIPGMMTGQILGGNPPFQAALYQAMVMFLISFTGSVGLTCTCIFAVHSVIDGGNRLRRTRLTKKEKTSDFVGGLVWWLLAPVLGGVTMTLLRLVRPLLWSLSLCGTQNADVRVEESIVHTTMPHTHDLAERNRELAKDLRRVRRELAAAQKVHDE
eukprot:TRINITY_DN40019_c0_g1_i1.p1 TRINITY_DN40019_c0_g1~~TRINITY_DN40019_c0_g1_i1.p1  ORF type:complete len:377 (+),score=99.81 TRINITY_DN40019_c0_g1_i1:13-1143(+)